MDASQIKIKTQCIFSSVHVGALFPGINLLPYICEPMCLSIIIGKGYKNSVGWGKV